jgi:nicotinate phosphoribosyltransferase
MIITTLADNDLYKFTMLQYHWKHLRGTVSTWAVTNRSKGIKLADLVDIEHLSLEINSLYDLRFTPAEIAYIGSQGNFDKDFLKWLKTFNFDKVSFAIVPSKTEEGQYEITFTGPIEQTTLWEIYVLAIINEMASVDPDPSKEDDDQEVAAFILHQKLQRLQENKVVFADMGTRRRHSFAWQDRAIRMAVDYGVIVGTSNVYFAMKYNLKAVGTNAHELPMAQAALAETDEDLKHSPYKVTELWGEMYPDRRTILPDTYGTSQFLKDAPEYLLDWPSIRPDSKDAYVAGEELIKWWLENDRNPQEKTVIFADGLDVDVSDNNDTYVLNGTDMVELRDYFAERVNLGFGWGTNFTNDFRAAGKKAMSIVCKLKTVNGRSAVKLSDNYLKAIGQPSEIDRYRRVFGTEGQTNIPVKV